jgi:hypothetical protein
MEGLIRDDATQRRGVEDVQGSLQVSQLAVLIKFCEETMRSSEWLPELTGAEETEETGITSSGIICWCHQRNQATGLGKMVEIIRRAQNVDKVNP